MVGIKGILLDQNWTIQLEHANIFFQTVHIFHSEQRIVILLMITNNRLSHLILSLIQKLDQQNPQLFIQMQYFYT